MADPAWPTSLPTRFNTPGWRLIPMSKALRTAQSVGRLKVRKRVTGNWEFFEGAMYFTRTQLSTFLTWWSATPVGGIDGGTVKFRALNHPISEVEKVWLFVEDYEIGPHPTGPLLMELRMKLAILPDTPS